MKIVKKLFEYLGMDLDMGMYNKYVISNELQVRIDKNKQNLI